MMSKKDYEKAAKIVKRYLALAKSAKHATISCAYDNAAGVAEEAFVSLFKDNPLFNESQFRAACQID